MHMGWSLITSDYWFNSVYILVDQVFYQTEVAGAVVLMFSYKCVNMSPITEWSVDVGLCFQD